MIIEALRRISIDQELAAKFGIPNVNCSAVFQVVANANTWANEYWDNDGVLYFFTARQEISRRLPFFNIKPDTVHRHIKKLAELGLILYDKQGKKDFTSLTDKGRQLFNFTMSEIDSSAMSEIDSNHYVGNRFEKSSTMSEIDSTYCDSSKINDLQKNSEIDSTELFLSLSKREIASPKIEFEAPNDPDYLAMAKLYREHGGTTKPRYDAKVFFIHVKQPERLDEFKLGLQNYLNNKKRDGTALQTFENFLRDGAWEGHSTVVAGDVVIPGLKKPENEKQQPTTCRNPDCRTPEAEMEGNGVCLWCNRPHLDPVTGMEWEVSA